VWGGDAPTEADAVLFGFVVDRFPDFLPERGDFLGGEAARSLTLQVAGVLVVDRLYRPCTLSIGIGRDRSGCGVVMPPLRPMLCCLA
jgi:hypothetical protein